MSGCPVCGRTLDFDSKLRIKECQSCGWKMKLKEKMVTQNVQQTVGLG